ncbi:hypothetical protein PROFUN_07557 [Planoprotostelium fungivorum]|uniref:Uncharacterized protein n=1 Tax=Planoprotostelium fungivorum TaxID=1890364 RepID=A0A2P6NLS3_9EUKA|nr:hypothetical protein PROFUN_07557 [Planoprotostelium fungivorum]
MVLSSRFQSEPNTNFWALNPRSASHKTPTRTRSMQHTGTSVPESQTPLLYLEHPDDDMEVYQCWGRHVQSIRGKREPPSYTLPGFRWGYAKVVFQANHRSESKDVRIVADDKHHFHIKGLTMPQFTDLGCSHPNRPTQLAITIYVYNDGLQLVGWYTIPGVTVAARPYQFPKEVQRARKGRTRMFALATTVYSEVSITQRHAMMTESSSSSPLNGQI